MNRLTKFFKALSNDRRLKILELLSRHGEMSVGNVSEEMNLSFKSISKHLLILEDVGLVNRKQVSTTVLYFPNKKLINKILSLFK